MKGMKYFEVTSHLVLYLGLSVGLVAMYRLRFSVSERLFVILLMIVFYLFWGFAYHVYKRDFSKKVYLEYLILAAIAAVVGVLVFWL